MRPAQSIKAPEIEVYPENWPALELIQALETQWHRGMEGKTGLMYGEAWAWMTEAGITARAERMDLMRATQVIERELLRIWRMQREARG